MTQYVYFFGGGKADGHKGMKDTLGGKGAGLAEMTNAGLPVPPGFTISTAACNLYQERKGRAASPHLSFVEMSAFFHQSVAVANYIKDLNLGIYYGLALPISKRLFR